MPESVVALRRFSRTAGALAAFLGCLVLVRWTLGITTSESADPGVSTMRPNTALGFILIGLSLLLLTAPGGSASKKIAARILAGLAFVLGTCTLVEYLLGWRFGIDQLLFEEPATPMAPLTALNFVLLGAALLSLEIKRRGIHQPAQLMAVAAGTIGFVAAVGYVYSLRSPHRLAAFVSMTLPTSVAFVLVSLGILTARPERGIASLLSSTGPGGTLARRLLPPILLATVVLGWLALAGEQAGLYSGEVEVGLLAISTIVLFTVIVYETALRIDAADQRHRGAEESIRQSELRKKAILDAALDAVITIDSAGTVLEFNPAAERLFGYSRAEAEGREMAELVIPPELREAHRQGLRRHATTGEARVLGQRLEMPAMRKDGQVFPAELAITKVDTGGLPLFTGYVRDISERKRNEDALRRSEERFRVLAAATSDVVWDWDVLSGDIWWNEGVQTLFGYDPHAAAADPNWWAQNVHPDHLRRVLGGIDDALAGGGNAWNDEYQFRRSDGSFARVLDRGFIIRDGSGRALRMIGATVDVTDRRSLEEQLRQAQKMEAVGQLAGGIAHDFNNLLTAVLGYAELLDQRIQDAPVLSEHVAEIRKAGERAASLTRQLLAFSRQQVLEPKVLDLNEVVRNVERMLQRLIGADIDLVTTLDPSLSSVLADAGQMEQVIVNLAVNSRDAMPRGGRLTIETQDVHLDEEYANSHAGTRPGPHVMIAVTDTGVGMDAATQSRVFEPFFTTKGKDKGTGLGLSMVYGIVRQSGGNLWVYSEPGQGTSFKIYLPAVDAAPAPVKTSVLPADEAPATETILVVEDDPSLRKLTRLILTRLGYTVLEAENGEDGLRVARAHAGKLDAVLTDVIMPGMGGSELARQLREMAPGAKVLFMSGYTDDAIVRHNVLGPAMAFIQKPFDPTTLARKLREVLAARE